MTERNTYICDRQNESAPIISINQRPIPFLHLHLRQRSGKRYTYQKVKAKNKLPGPPFINP